MSKSWVTVEGFEGYYWVNRRGQIKNKKGHILKPVDNGSGYLRVDLRKDGQREQLLIHRVVAQAFVPNPDNKPEVNHKNSNTKYNWACNLEWVTRLENVAHRDDRRRAKNDTRRTV